MAGTNKGVLMVESEAQQLSEDEMLEAVEIGQKTYNEVIDAIHFFESIHVKIFEVINKINKEFVILIAVYVGNIRLIDNIIIEEKNG